MIIMQCRQVLALLKWTCLSAASDIPENAAISAASFSSTCPYSSKHTTTAQTHITNKHQTLNLTAELSVNKCKLQVSSIYFLLTSSS